jgi:hypothetical protein
VHPAASSWLEKEKKKTRRLRSLARLTTRRRWRDERGVARRRTPEGAMIRCLLFRDLGGGVSLLGDAGDELLEER